MQQPGTQAAADVASKTSAIVDDLKSLEGPLLPILHEVQAEFGYLPTESLLVIAEGLNISRAEIHGVVSFYHDYRREPGGRHTLKLCQAEACQSMGSEKIAAQVKQHLGIDFHETARDGSVTLEPVYCLGLCSCAPSALLDDEPIGRLDADKVDEIVAEVRR